MTFECKQQAWRSLPPMPALLGGTCTVGGARSLHACVAALFAGLMLVSAGCGGSVDGGATREPQAEGAADSDIATGDADIATDLPPADDDAPLPPASTNLVVTGPDPSSVVTVMVSGLDACATSSHHVVEIRPSSATAVNGAYGLFGSAGPDSQSIVELNTRALTSPFAGNDPVGVSIASDEGAALRYGDYTVLLRDCSDGEPTGAVLATATFSIAVPDETVDYLYSIAAGDGTRNWKHLVREVRPKTLPANPRAVVVLHGYSGTGKSIQSALNLDDAYLESRGEASMTAVFPTGLGALPGWTNDQFTNVGVSDDVSFLEDLAAYLKSVGYTRVDLMGYSAGGEMAQLMYCKSATGSFAAFGSISGPMNYAKHAGPGLMHCTPATPLPPIYMVQGDSDSTIGTTRAIAVTTTAAAGDPTDVDSKMFVAGTAASGSNYDADYWNVCGNATCNDGTTVAGQGWAAYDEAAVLAQARCANTTPVATLAEPFSGSHAMSTSGSLSTDTFLWCDGTIRVARVRGGEHGLTRNWSKDWNQQFFDFFYARGDGP